MKSKTMKRILALILCMALVLGCGTYALADEAVGEAPVSQEGQMESAETDVTESDDAEGTEAEPNDSTGTDAPVVVDDTDAADDTDPAGDTDAEPQTKPEKQQDTDPAQVLTYSDDDVEIQVTETEAGAIPEDATLQVTPITADDEEYDSVKEQLDEKASAENYTVAGFLAYDISFVDADGKKIEPNGSVKVTMEYKDAALPTDIPEDTENLDVTVMHFEEDADGEVKEIVDMVAEKDQAAAVETGSSMEVTKAEFETSSFSTFTITWKSGYYSSTKTVTIVDTDGKEISTAPAISSKDIIAATALATIAPTVGGYVYEKATITSYNGTEIKRIRYNNRWQYSTVDTGDNSGWYRVNNSNIYFVYKQLVNKVEIQDNLMNTGDYKAVVSLTNSQDKIVKYEWFRSSSENGDYALVKKIEYQGEKSNLSKDEDQLYPAFDKGAQKWYKVKVTVQKEDGTTYVMESDPMQVAYYDELKNGSFESPTVKSEVEDESTSNYQWSNAAYASAGGVWQTTGLGAYNTSKIEDMTGHDIEVVDRNQGDTIGNYAWYIAANNPNKTPQIPDGDQFAELNCEAAGALYQDVLTLEGTDLNYWLSHRARGRTSSSAAEYDTMFLVIMPTKIAVEEDLTTQPKLESYLKTLGLETVYKKEYKSVGEEIVHAEDGNGVLVVRITSDDQSWHHISETLGYTPTSSLTRFFFVAGSVASGDATMGNFLDRVGFSQSLPPVNDGEFTIQIEKKIEGLGNADLTALQKNLNFKFQVTQNGKQLSDAEVEALLGRTTLSGAEMRTLPDGSLVYVISNRAIANDATYQVTVVETDADVTGYTRTTTASTSVSVDNGTPTETENAVIAQLKSKTTATVTFTNTYEASNYKNVHFTKIWDDGNNKFNTRPESLAVTLHAKVSVEEEGTMVEKTLSDLEQTTTLSADNGWACSWQVPVYYNLDGGGKVKIQYWVTEGTINSAYVYKPVLLTGSAYPGDGSDYRFTNFDNVITEGDADTSKQSKRLRMSTQQSSALLASVATTAETSTNNLGEPAHTKYITYNANTAEYTLNLDVKGAKGDAPGVDVLFVIDRSGSMGSGAGSTYTNLLPEVQRLLTKNDGVIDQIFAKEGNVNSIAYVAFSSKKGTYTSSWYQASNKASLKSSINGLNASGGTNWTYAMKAASDVMSKKRNSQNEKVVIFLSDGKPTYTLDYWGNEDGDGNNTSSSYYSDAANQVANSSYLKTAKFYSIYLTNGTKTGMETFTNLLTQKGVSASLENGTSLNTALTNILNQIIPTYKDVVITDTLSEYVVFAEGDPKVTVTKRTAAGVVTTLDASQYTATVDPASKKVTVSLLNGGSLEDGATYTISFKVKPSEKANTEYAQNNSYPHTGDAGTGSTSANQKGFYSNDYDKTNVSYKIDGTSDSGTAKYPRPVVQVTTHTLSYEKVWQQPDAITAPDGNVVLHVVYTDGTTGTVTLTKANGYKYTETVPVTKNIASVTEDAIADYTPSYQITDGGAKAIVTNSYSKVTSSSITVNKVWSGTGPKNPIQVSLYQSSNDGTAKRYGEIVTLSEANNWTYTWTKLPGSESNGNSHTTYSYAVREETIPDNYVSNITYTYGTDTTTATITNVYDENCADEYFYIANVLQTEQWTMTKEWDDKDDILGERPDSIDVTINGMSFAVKATDGWTKTVRVLKKANTTSYTATESGMGDLYEQTDMVLNKTSDGMDVTFTNSLKTKSITVHKAWNDGDIETRPDNIKFKLQYSEDGGTTWKDYEEDYYTMTEEDVHNSQTWTMEISHLPAVYQYRVVEITMADASYISDVSVAGDAYTITNTLTWTARKVNDQLDDEKIIGLKGAEFELKDSGNKVIASGKSDKDGIVEWTVTSAAVDINKLNGSYTIVETKAPDGYAIHDGGWAVTFVNGLLTTFDGTSVKGTGTDGVVIQLTNEPVYELPQSGGHGIFAGMLCGLGCLMAAAYVFHRRRCKVIIRK